MYTKAYRAAGILSCVSNISKIPSGIYLDACSPLRVTRYSEYFLLDYLMSNTDFTFKLVASPDTIVTRLVPLPISKKLSDNTKSSLSLLI